MVAQYFRFGGQDVTPTNWEEIEIDVTFDDEDENGVIREATITIDRLRFVGDDCRLIHARALNGLNGGPGITEGESFEIGFSKDDGSTFNAQYYVDFVGTSEEDTYSFGRFLDGDFEQPSECFVTIKKDLSVSNLANVISGTTFGLLDSENVFTENDYVNVRWIAKKKFDFIEILIVTLALVQIIKEIAEIPEKINQDIAQVSAIAGTGGFGSIFAAILYGIAIALIRAIYILAVVGAYITLYQRLVSIIYPYQLDQKGAYLRTLLEKAFAYFDLKFVSPIEELDTFVFLPTLPSETPDSIVEEFLKKIKVTEKGIPSINDNGFLLSEFVNIMRRMFWARLALVQGPDGDEVHLRSNNDSWWYKNGNTPILRDVLIDSGYTFNPYDIKLVDFFKFLEDPSDQWTLDDIEGLSRERITQQNTVGNQKRVGIKGIERFTIPWALGSRKGPNDFIENLIVSAGNTAQTLLNLLGVNLNLGNFDNRESALKTSGYTYSVPKVLYLPNGTEGGIPENHRDFLSAQALDKKYHSNRSFVRVLGDESNPTFNNQHLNFPNTKIPFDFSDFEKLVENSYFVDDQGQAGKIDSLTYRPAGDTAQVNGYFAYRYTENLKQTIKDV